MKKLLTILLCLALLLALCACGGGDTKSAGAGDRSDAAPPETKAPAPAATPAPAADPTGVYLMTGVSAADESHEDDVVAAMELMEALQVRVFLVLNADGSGCFDVLSQQTPLRWDADAIYMEDDAGEEEQQRIPYELDGETLTMVQDEGSISFMLLTGEELADYEENGSGEFDWGDMDWGAAYEPIPEGEPSVGPVSGVVDGCGVTVLGAELFKGDEDEDLLRVYCEFVNETDAPQSAMQMFYTEAVQDGEDLDYGYVFGETRAPEDDYSTIRILPGKTMRWTVVRSCDPAGGTIGLRISGGFGGDAVLYYVDPAAPLGAPEEPFAFEKDPAIPADLYALPAEMDGVRMGDSDYTVDYYGNTLIRFYFDFTNESGEPDSFYSSHSFCAFQDGYELETGSSDEWIEAEGMLFEDLEPDETATCAVCFLLRSDSPVVFMITEDFGDGRIGTVVDEVVAPVAGTYRLETIDGYTAEEYASYMGISVEEFRELISVTLRPDGTADWREMDESIALNWSLDGEELSLCTDDGEETLSCTLRGGVITIAADGAEIVLAR